MAVFIGYTSDSSLVTFVFMRADGKGRLTPEDVLFGFHPWDIAEVFVGGARRYRRGDPAPYDGQACRDAARRIWDGMRKM